ncbi:hypothetical protein, partial [Salinicoccus jeotgali]|uniref:hypothetical protein n=1 Tax=Salinicoccus jeotgali TaxID=381634 RepID=UPI0031E1859F
SEKTEKAGPIWHADIPIQRGAPLDRDEKYGIYACNLLTNRKKYLGNVQYSLMLLDHSKYECKNYSG